MWLRSAAGRAVPLAPAFAVAFVLTGLSLTGCSSPHGHPVQPTPTTSPVHSRNPARSEDDLRHKAEASLTRSSQVKLHWVGPVKGPTALPRTAVDLNDGGSYVVEAACAGVGSLGFSRVTAVPHTGNPTVTCNRHVLRYAFTGGDLISFAFQTYKPASAILAWQVIAVAE